MARRIESQKRALIAVIQDVYLRRLRPEEIRAHFSSIQTLIANARQQPDLTTLTLDLIVALHPLPIEWGFWMGWREALDFALDACTTRNLLGLRVRFLNHLAYMLHFTGQFEESLAVCAEIRAHDHTVASTADLVGGVHTETLILLLQGKNDAAWARIEALATNPLLAQLPDPALTEAKARLTLMRQEYYRQVSDYPRALAALSETIDAFAHAPLADGALHADLFRCRGVIHWVTAAYADAARDFRSALDISLSRGDRIGECAVQANLGLAYWSLGQLKEAEDCKQSAIAIARSTRASWRLTRQVGDLALIYLFQGRLDRALECLEDQFRMASRLGIEREAARARMNQAIVYFHLGDVTRATQAIVENLPHVQVLEWIGVARVNLSRCYNAQGRPDEAKREAETALETGRSRDLPALAIVALRALGECMPGQAGEAQTREALDQARRFARRMDEAGCLFELARCAVERAACGALWNEAITLLAHMGAEGWVAAARARPRNAPPRLPAVC